MVVSQLPNDEEIAKGEPNMLEKIKIAVKALDDKKGENICVIDISEQTVITDYFIIVNGNSPSQVQALVENVTEALEKNGVTLLQSEGKASGNWILLDFNDIIVHVFLKEDREFYDLERMWRDGKFIDVNTLLS